MTISGIQKLTLLDYPELTSCLIFTQGCNFRCPYCQNSSLILDKNEDGKIDEEEIFAYLEKRKKLIDGICISGGEPLLQKDLEKFIIKVKNKGFKVKLDTNGSNPNKLKKFIDKNLVDYVAMDIKNSFDKYDETIGMKIDIDKVKDSIEILKKSKIDYEFRTTIVKEYHTLQDIENICNYIGKDSKYYLQNYRYCETVIDKSLHGFKEEELLAMKEKLNKKYPNLIVRGI